MLNAAFVAAADQSTSPPNVVLLPIDNVGYGDIGCYGNPVIRTPHIDRLAAQGARCTDFYIVTSSCTPSRGALMTGRYPLRNGLTKQLSTPENWTGIGLPHRERIFPQFLKDAGYVSGCFGKWNLGYAEGSRPTDRGFDEFFGCRSGNIDYYTHVYNGQEDMRRNGDPEPLEVEGYSTDLFADAACEFIREQHEAKRPLFAYVPFNAVHIPNPKNKAEGVPTVWQAPAEFFEHLTCEVERGHWAGMKSPIHSQVESLIAALQDGREEEASERESELKKAVDDVASLEEALQVVRIDPRNSFYQDNLRTTIEKASVAIGNINMDGGDVNIHVAAGDKPDSTLSRYRRELALEFTTVKSFATVRGRGGIDARRADAPRLVEVYADLTVEVRNPSGKKHEDEDGKSLGEELKGESENVLQAVAGNRQCVILGDPGSGKSTFVRYFGHLLAVGDVDDEKLELWPEAERQLLPVPVFVRELAKWMGEQEQRPEPDDLTLWKFLDHRWGERIDGVGQAIRDQFDEGDQLMVIFDGLDEAPSRDGRRTWVADLICAVVDRNDGQNRVVVTSRRRNYRHGDSWALDEERFPLLRLEDLTPAQIEKFVRGWYGELVRIGEVDGTVEQLASSLCAEVDRQGLAGLAGKPLLLTMMALIHGEPGNRLPNGKPKLYEKIVDLLLCEWQRAEKGRETLDAILDEANVSAEAVKNELARLSFEGFRKAYAEKSDAGEGRDEVGLTISAVDLKTTFRSLHFGGEEEKTSWADRLLEHIQYRSGLLIPGAEQAFEFPHKSFGEYLAAWWLTEIALDCGAELREVVNDLNDWDDWREIGIFAASMLGFAGKTAWAAEVAAKFSLGRTSGKKQKPAWEREIVSAEIAEAAGVQRMLALETGKTIVNRLRKRMYTVIGDGRLDPPLRARAGRVLGELGDPRPGVGTWIVDGLELPDFAWSEVIPAGYFPMGNDKDESFDSEEQPRFECTRISDDYTLSVYPVTVAQFACFVKDGGYTDKEQLDTCWTAAGRAWLENNRIIGPLDEDESVFQTSNHPRGGVSWFEALAFCRWYNQVRPEREPVIGLPTEAQWERTARNGSERRLFPWRDDDLDDRCNYAYEIGHSSAVGIFPQGAAAGGAMDLSGNVWEWCQTRWRGNYENYNAEVSEDEEGDALRVLRGGAFLDRRVNVRSALRFRNRPDYRSWHLGFRVSSSPSSSQ